MQGEYRQLADEKTSKVARSDPPADSGIKSVYVFCRRQSPILLPMKQKSVVCQPTEDATVGLIDVDYVVRRIAVSETESRSVNQVARRARGSQCTAHTYRYLPMPVRGDSNRAVPNMAM